MVADCCSIIALNWQRGRTSRHEPFKHGRAGKVAINLWSEARSPSSKTEEVNGRLNMTQRRTKAQLKATAYHEAGHAVAVYFLTGKPPKRVTIVHADGAYGSVTHRNTIKELTTRAISAQVHMRAQHHIMICFAGPIAQRRHAPQSIRRWHSGDDYKTAIAIAWELTDPAEGEMNAFLRWLEIRTKKLVEGRWKAIDALAKTLLAKPTLDSAEILALIADPAPPMLSADAIKRILDRGARP